MPKTADMINRKGTFGRARAGFSPALLVLVAVIGGCGPGPDIATLEVTQRGWDSLRVSLRFADRDLLGRTRVATPDSVHFTVFNGRYDTLYAGSKPVIPIDDRGLGDAEPILVEGCGRFDSVPVCEQQTVFASPKRVFSEIQVDYPTDDAYMRGTYRMAPKVERRVFDGDTWEALPGATVPPLTAVVRVDGSDVQGIRLPLRVKRGPFDLHGGDGYRDFRFHLRSAFRDSGRAEVVFQVLAGAPGRESPAGSQRIVLVDKSEEELLQELESLVEAAARLIVRRVRRAFGSGRTYVFVNSWSYDSSERAYDAEIELHVPDYGRFSWIVLTGHLHVPEAGSGAVFRLTDADRDGADRWMDEVGADSLELGSIGLNSREGRSRPRGWG